MKPTSIVSLIIAALLVVLGLVTCIIAQNMANANGEFLFSETREDGLVNTVDLTESEISKIELIVSDAEINIIGRSDKSCIEFVNFRENYYNLSAANRVLSFSEIPDITSMLKFWENGFSFKGMRYILNFAKDQKETANTKKVVNLYLSRDKEIKIFEIQANNCTLNIEGMTSATDYNITVKNAEINATGLKTSSSFNINSREDDAPAKSVTLTMSTALITRLNINAVELNMDAKLFRCSDEANIVCESGNIAIESVKRVENMNMELKSDSGAIILDGKGVSSPYNHATGNAEDAKCTVTTKTADIRIGYVNSGAPDDNTDPENTSDPGNGN